MSTNVPKYAPLPAIDLPDRQWPSRALRTSPVWCTSDLRDGNQALPNPLGPEQKLELFNMLCRIGFKHIEVSFPSASQDDFDFTRMLIEKEMIPDDVWIMVLTQCREHLIRRTVEALKGVKRAIVHVYLPMSDLHLERVLDLDREKAMKMAVEGTRLVSRLVDEMPESDIRYQFSPEEFTDSDMGFILDTCRNVVDAWGKASREKPVILNLPATVERRPPNHYADMIEWFSRNMPERDRVVISLHAHNDQGMAVAATELALLAGADRVEGTLFGHGERTGNVDLVTLAGNLESRGIDTGLDFSHLPEVVETVERLTGMEVYYRQPYAGDLVFTAFSGSHQDAIRKGLKRRDGSAGRFGMDWKVPYLHVDPADFGRAYDRLIRVNSQSGKGGVAWVLEQDFNMLVPKGMQAELGAEAQVYLDALGREITSDELFGMFVEKFMNLVTPYGLVNFWPRPDADDPAWVNGELRLLIGGEEKAAWARGNGPLSAFSRAAAELTGLEFTIADYHEQSVGKSSDAAAYAYVQLQFPEGGKVFGAGSSTNVVQAAIRAALAALNRHANMAR